jgi:hypothetical protein
MGKLPVNGVVLPDFALPYLRSSIVLIAFFLVARLLQGQTLKRAG